MNVSGVSSNNVVNLYNDNKKKIEKKQSVASNDSLQISSLGRKMANFSSSVTSEVSEEKIQGIKNQIANGTYNRDSKLVAKKIIDVMKGREY